MFYYATAFDQDIGSWNVVLVTNMSDMFTNVTLSRENYDSILSNWSTLTLKSNVTFHAGSNTQFSSTVESAKNTIINNFNWTIYDGGMVVVENPVFNNLVSYWNFNESSGSTVIDVQSGYNGTIYNATRTGSGKIGNAISFIGSPNYVVLPHNSNHNSNDATWSVWFKTHSTTIPAIAGILTKAPNTGYDRQIYVAMNSTGGITVAIGNSARTNWAYLYTISGSYNNTNWHHLVVTKKYGVSGDTFKSYMNGSLINTTNSAFNGRKNSNQFDVGRTTTSSSSNRYFKGIIDEIGVWNRELSSSEISELYNNGNGLGKN